MHCATSRSPGNKKTAYCDKLIIAAYFICSATKNNSILTRFCIFCTTLVFTLKFDEILGTVFFQKYLRDIFYFYMGRLIYS